MKDWVRKDAINFSPSDYLLMLKKKRHSWLYNLSAYAIYVLIEI